MSTSNNYIGEPLSFFQLFAEKDLRIEVPIIQRDYAQGRSRESEVRNNFLEALFNYLDEDKPGRELDFVYGAISETGNGQSFIPLDGQQRLTTLFLLHWYLSLVGGRTDDLKQIMVDQSNRSKFSYETRSSTSEFCTCILTKSLLYNGYDSKRSVSGLIKNEGWYFKVWDFDPSISAMLEMLDAIEEKFHQHDHFYERLTSLKCPIITFQFLNLKHFGLTDDLYIKMNSRGKPLNPFENFKAKLEQKIESLSTGSDFNFPLQLSGEFIERSPSRYFSDRIDTKWLNHFWEVGGKNAKLVDAQIMNFIRVILSNSYAVSSMNYSGENARVLFKTQDAKYGQHDKDNLSYFSYESLGALFKKSLEKIMFSFEQLLLISKIEPSHIPDPYHYNHFLVFNDVISHNLTAGNRILFHAFISYLILHEGNLEGLKDWMRVIFNLVENTRLEDTNDVTTALKTVEEMLAVSNYILQTLSGHDIQIGFFYSRQVEEEKIKACLIVKSVRWSTAIYLTEKHNVLKSQIGFLLEFSEILSYYNKNRNCDWSDTDDEQYFTKFGEYAEKTIATLDYLKNRKDSEYLWERAVLTKGDYLLPSSSYRYHFLNTTSLTDRDNSWKRLLRLNRDTDGLAAWDVKRKYVMQVFDDARFNKADVKNSCVAIVKDQVQDWRSFFIADPELIAYCERGFIRRENNLKIHLLETTKLTYHYELRTIDLYLNSIEGQDLLPLTNTKYEKEYGFDGHSHIHLGEFAHQKKGYQLKIYFDEVNHYSLQLRELYALPDPTPYDESIIALCKKHNLNPNDWRGFSFVSKSKSDIISKLKLVIGDL
ncbi:MAG: DUF262 domain-containing protein [Chitinophagaceae bacterium]